MPLVASRARKQRTFFPALGLLLLAPTAHAAPPHVGRLFQSVTLDGVRLGEDLTPAPENYSAFPTVVYDGASHLFHMWVSGGDLRIESTVHATSRDGVHFTSTGTLRLPRDLDWTTYGMPTNVEPQMAFVRASHVGGTWKLAYWTDNGPGESPPQDYGSQYNYNSSMNDLGADPGNLLVRHQGALGPTSGGTFGQSIGPWGLVQTGGDTFFFTSYDPAAGLAKFAYSDEIPPVVSVAPVASQDLVAATGYTWFLTDPLFPDAPAGDVYIHNVGRVLDQEDGSLGVYYSLRAWQTSARVGQQIFYAESRDGGGTWTPPVGLFPSRAEQGQCALRVDGIQACRGISHPEVTMYRGSRVLYVSTFAGDGSIVVATNAARFVRREQVKHPERPNHRR